jgi:CO/xanthine dehydrogenase FAD-binding subunit
MIDFEYVKALDVSDAVSQIARDANARFIAGGTNLIDLMKENVTKPKRLIDITGLPLAEIEETETGGLRIGALVSNSDLAYDQRVRERYPLFVERYPRRRLCPAPQYGFDRRQSIAADPLPLFLRHDHCLQ